jgi:hypothetical protein
MTTIPQVARAMREILTTTAAEAGRTTRFVQRTSPLNGATFSQALVFGFLGNPQATLEELTQSGRFGRRDQPTSARSTFYGIGRGLPAPGACDRHRAGDHG